MNFYQFLTILNARKKIAIFAFLVTVTTTVVVSLILPKTYESYTSLVVNYTGTDPVTGMVTMMAPSYMATQVDVINSRNVALKVVDELNLHINPAYLELYSEATEGQGDIRNWIAGLIQRSLNVIPSLQGGIITIGYEANDPSFAALMANTFANSYIDTNLELKIAPSVRTADWFRKRVESVRNDLMEAQNKLSIYQAEKGIISADKRLDVENTRLSQMSQRLVQLQSELLSLESKRNEVNFDDLEGSNNESISDPILQQLKSSLVRSEVKRNEMKQRVSKNHPDYLAVNSEVASIKRKLKKQLKLAVTRMDTKISVTKKDIEKTKLSIDLQKATLLQINKDRNVFDVLARDVEDTKQILSLTNQRLSQIELAGASKEGNVSVLTPAVAPLEPSKPKIIINTILSVILGGIIAIGLALLLELTNRKVRTTNDILTGTDLPVLGEIKYSKV